MFNSTDFQTEGQEGKEGVLIKTCSIQPTPPLKDKKEKKKKKHGSDEEDEVGMSHVQCFCVTLEWEHTSEKICFFSVGVKHLGG